MATYPHFNPTKYNLDVKVAQVRTSFHCKYNINYHLIWIPKYRKRLLRGRVAEVLEEIIRGQCEQYHWDCLALEVMPDHIHLFLSAGPTWQPSKIVNLLKGNTSRQLRRAFPRLKYLGYNTRWRKGFPALWAKGYYCGTAGHVSAKQVIRYIAEQEGKEAFDYDIKQGEQPKPVQHPDGQTTLSKWGGAS